MSLSRAQIEEVARLARLLLSDEEAERMTRELDQIVQYVNQLSELDTEDVEPMAHAGDLTNVFRPDELAPSVDREGMLHNAPKRDDACYRVPAVMGD